ncbi:armadillo-type protein [Cladochytrium replicatum]|nr:armadillo-type protein [Cladochytrium replicatum]
MVASNHDRAAIDIGSSVPTERLKAIRYIKNTIIGNFTKKELYITLGVLPKLVDILRDPSSSIELKIESAVALSSFAHGSDRHVWAIVSTGAIPPLLDCTCSSWSRETMEDVSGQCTDDQARLVEASARAIKAIYMCPGVSREELVRLLNIPKDLNFSGQSHASLTPLRTTEVVASIIARIGVTYSEQSRLASTGAIPLLVKLLDPAAGAVGKSGSSYPRLQEAALEALASLCRENAIVGRKIVECTTEQGDSSVAVIFKLTREKRPLMKLLAATCLTNLVRTKTLSTDRHEEAVHILLPTIIMLFSEIIPTPASVQPPFPSKAAPSSSKTHAPLVFAYLVWDNEKLQKTSMDKEAIVKLSQMIFCLEEEHGDGTVEEISRAAASAATGASGKSALGTGPPALKVRRSALLAIAAICYHSEECRKAVIESKVLPHIVAAMYHPANVGIRAAACQCTRSLSRSVKNLRTALVDSRISLPLISLLADAAHPVVQITACATLCNIVLDFSPMKKTVVDFGGVERLVELVGDGSAEDSPRSVNGNLRMNAVWALNNLLFNADLEVKQRVMSALGWNTLERLLFDPDLMVQRQALNLLRNLTSTRSGEDYIDAVFRGLGAERLTSILESKLLYMHQTPEITLHVSYELSQTWAQFTPDGAVYVPGTDHRLLRLVRAYLRHEVSVVRVAALWVIINLTWTDDGGASERVQLLREKLGIEEALGAMADDTDMDVRERVKTALGHFGAVRGVTRESVVGELEARAAALATVAALQAREEGEGVGMGRGSAASAAAAAWALGAMLSWERGGEVPPPPPSDELGM